MPFMATINTPGYLPNLDDDPPVFDTAAEAWWYLYHERCDHERDVPMDEEPPTEVECLHCGKTAEFSRVSQGEPGRHYTCTVCHLDSFILADGGDDSETGEALAQFAKEDKTGTIIGDTPGYDGDHDLGLAYTVTEVEA